MALFPPDTPPRFENAAFDSCRILDSIWEQYGVVFPLGAVVIESPDGDKFLIETGKPELMLSNLRSSPRDLYMAEKLERARVLTSTHAWILVIPHSGVPLASVYSARGQGRHLAREGLEELLDIAWGDQPIGSEGVS